MASAEFAVNNKTHTTTKVLLFMANYGKEVRMEGDIRKKGKVERATEFVKRMKKVHKEAKAALKKTQEEMKRYADRSRKKMEKWKRGDKMLLSTKNLVFKERPVKKLTERYIGPYTIEKIISSNAVKLQLPNSMRIYLVVNVSWIIQYKEQVKGQMKEEEKLVEVEEVEEWEVEKILNKKRIRKVEKYLVWWKRFMAEEDIWERRENLKNAEKTLEELEGRMSAKVRRQERIDIAEERNFRRGKLLKKFIARMLYRWEDRKFKEEYLKKLERNWRRWKAVSPEEKP